jgi:tetratricopeptide (TPR) repeat protein
MKHQINIILFLLISHIAFGQNKAVDQDAIKKRQEEIIDEHLTNGAQKYNYNYEMAEWQKSLDEGLKKDNTIAYLWQQKAMPYFKAKKYEVGMTFIDKAVIYDAQNWQPYRAFIKCIFAKTYKDAIIDFEDCKKKWGNNYVMDHTFNFYIALCYLQLNDFLKAELLLKEYNDTLFADRDSLEHPTALFYYGIAKYEQSKWEEAIIIFDKALKIYPNFSDVKYYKAICLARLGKQEEVTKLLNEAKQDAKIGYTINEDNTIYETYPYQKKWQD